MEVANKERLGRLVVWGPLFFLTVPGLFFGLLMAMPGVQFELQRTLLNIAMTCILVGMVPFVTALFWHLIVEVLWKGN